ncbi:MAG: 4-(cytidine 5'-diphospho)-2-C-methyl-D-erythritol kinase [Candidatus Omnitrophota bacterium]
MKSLQLASYAKLNLYLEILGRLPDKYHAIFTLFERVSLCDQIRLKTLPSNKGIRIVLSNPKLCLPRGCNNLAYRAADQFKKEFKIRQGVEICIDKQIPISAGLGGGSSNAAAVLGGLNRLWGLRIKRERLVSIAGKIGADVPFFLYNCSFASAVSRGDKIKVLRLPVKLWHILVVPRVKVSSYLAYKKWDLNASRLQKKISISILKGDAGLTIPQSRVKIIKSALSSKDFPGLKRLLINSLEPVSMSMHPVIRKVKSVLSNFGVEMILMSGSGPSVFGLVPSRKEAYAIAGQLSKFVTWDVFVVKTV